MTISVRIAPDPIPVNQSGTSPGFGSGALAEFRGLVRGEERGRPISALVYEAYQPMAEREITRILDDLTLAHPCIAVEVRHRTGRVAVGECAVYVGVIARHRAEAFAVLAGFLDRLKQDVPIWKTEIIPA